MIYFSRHENHPKDPDAGITEAMETFRDSFADRRTPIGDVGWLWLGKASDHQAAVRRQVPVGGLDNGNEKL